VIQDDGVHYGQDGNHIGLLFETSEGDRNRGKRDSNRDSNMNLAFPEVKQGGKPRTQEGKTRGTWGQDIEIPSFCKGSSKRGVERDSSRSAGDDSSHVTQGGIKSSDLGVFLRMGSEEGQTRGGEGA